MLSKIIEQSAKYAMERPAAFLRYTTAGIFTISTLAQAGGLVINKSIPKKEKNFLLSQELINGVLEMATFITIASGLEKLGKYLVEKGIIIGTNVGKNAASFNKGVTLAFSLAGTLLAFNLVTPLLRNPIVNFIQKKFKTDNNDPEQLTRPMIPALPINDRGGLDVVSESPFNNFEFKTQTTQLNTTPAITKTPIFTSTAMRV